MTRKRSIAIGVAVGTSPPLLTLAAEWAAMEEHLIADDINADMRGWLRDHFYFGAAAVFDVMDRGVAANGQAIDADSRCLFDTMTDEIFRFYEEGSEREPEDDADGDTDTDPDTDDEQTERSTT